MGPWWENRLPEDEIKPTAPGYGPYEYGGYMESEETPVERYAEIIRCTWDPRDERWHFNGYLVLEYDEDNGEEYDFSLVNQGPEYRVEEDAGGKKIPEVEKKWLEKWAKQHLDTAD